MTRSLTLFRGSPATNTYVWSPFVTKLEARLRFEDVSYKLAVGSPKSAPRGKIPYIQLGGDEKLGDSTLIIKQLVANDLLSDLNAKLSPTERAQDLAIRALLEEKLYFYTVREKWEDNYVTMRDGALAAVPWPIRIVVGWVAQSTLLRTLYGQGSGRLDDQEISLLRGEVWDAVDGLLLEARPKSSGAGKEPFWFLGGALPTEADASLYGFITASLVCTACPVSTDIVKSYPVLMDYVGRIHDAYFPDYERWD
ncbi:hypothetical protein V2G26_006427 [Clonostachys chloroleuca]|uniref:Thioredoxin-like fold domain-containing protein n=1 Tax=Clonostachys chloroleuca TaxID=1926264 RepID=A0AA35Q124_9HYPO|nr:unnamed protein product [Clonostachys chloroleuca]